jgi:hypothetical protein
MHCVIKYDGVFFLARIIEYSELREIKFLFAPVEGYGAYGDEADLPFDLYILPNDTELEDFSWCLVRTALPIPPTLNTRVLNLGCNPNRRCAACRRRCSAPPRCRCTTHPPPAHPCTHAPPRTPTRPRTPRTPAHPRAPAHPRKMCSHSVACPTNPASASRAA